MAKYINPFTDWGFKRLFGQEFTKDLLIDFLNDLLVGEQHVKDSKEPATDKLRFIYLALPLFDKKAEECDTDFDKWIYVLKHMEALKRMPFTAQKEIFKRLEEYANTHHLNQKENEAYINSLWIAYDNAAVMEGARIEGRMEGRKEGREEGREEERARNVRSLLEMGLSTEQVAQALKLPIGEIIKIKQSM